MKQQWIRNILGGLTFTSALFVFQACYGTPQDFGSDVLVEGQVKSLNSGMPIKGIKVSVAENTQYEITDEEGCFSFYMEIMENATLQFEDIDAGQNGTYVRKDTVLTLVNEPVYLEINLEEK
jgi:hypothetical protein